jgi:uncharacterized protein (TIGR03083 family)
MSDPRELFARAARSLADVVDTIRADQWDAPGLGVWDVRSLVGHALRGVTTPEEYLAQPAAAAGIGSVGEYFAAAMATPGLHDAVAERGRLGGLALGDAPAAAVRATVERVVPIVTATPLDTIFTLPFGTITLGVYLPTRIIEVVVHTDDLCRAVGHDPVASREEVEAVLVAASSIVGRRSGLEIIRAVMGRAPLPEGFNLWG